MTALDWGLVVGVIGIGFCVANLVDRWKNRKGSMADRLFGDWFTWLFIAFFILVILKATDAWRLVI